MNRKLLFLFSMSILLISCNRELIKTDYQNKNLVLSKEDKVILLPTSVMKDIDVGTRELEIVYNHVVFSLFKEKGFQIIGEEEVLAFLKKNKIDPAEIQQANFNAINKETIEKLKELNPKYFMKMILIASPRESIMDKQDIFVLLKMFTLTGEETRVLTIEYEGEDQISSLKIFDIVLERIKDWINYEEKLIKNTNAK